MTDPLPTNEMPSPYRVVVVDNELPLARAIAESLRMEPDMDVAGVAANGVEALALIREALPDVVLMDLDMPVMGGIEVIMRVKQEMPSVEFLVLTVYGDNEHLFDALQAGARGYLLKDAGLDEVADAVRKVARGAAAIPPALAVRVLAEFQRLGGQAPALRRLYSLLTRQEAEVLRLIGWGRTNKEIAEELVVELTTVKKQVTHIRQKLEINSRTEAVLIAQRSGLLDEDGPKAH